MGSSEPSEGHKSSREEVYIENDDQPDSVIVLAPFM